MLERQLDKAESLYDKVASNNIEFCNLIHPNVSILDNTTLGKGNIICSGTYISCDCNIGNNTLFQPNSSLGHNCNIGDNTVISTFSNIAGILFR